MKTVIHNIGTLAGILPEGIQKLEGAQMNQVECVENAYLVIENGVIAEFGSGEGYGIKNTPTPRHTECTDAVEYIDAKGGYVMPCFCDSHTHIVYA